MDTLKVEVDISKVLILGRVLSEAAMIRAWRRALRKTANWVKGQTAKAVSKETKIAQKVIRQRLYFFLRSKAEGKVWLGLNRIEAHRLGKVRQTRKGVSAGRFSFPGAWLKKKVAPEGPIYRRVGENRLPYELVTHDWAESGEKAFRAVATVVGDRLRTVLKQEINYEIQKAIGNAR